MKTSFTGFVCRILVLCMAALPLQAQAVLIDTGEAVAARATVNSFIERSEVARQLQALGVSPQLANERVAALSDAEVALLADRIDRLPAGAFAGQGLGLLIVAIFLLWRFVYSDQAKAEAAAVKPKSEAAKPKPEPKKQ